MEIAIYPIKSILHDERLLSEVSASFIEAIRRESEHHFKIVTDPKALNDADLGLVLVQSGGSEGLFKSTVFPAYGGPYYLLTYGSSNSLAASLEILTFVHQSVRGGEILHGAPESIAKRIDALLDLKKTRSLKSARYGVLGEPSDWLIGSEVDPAKARSIFGMELIKIPEGEVIEAIKDTPLPDETPDFPAFDLQELKKAYGAYLALKGLVEKYGLDGFTIRCFDVISACHLSACLALALLNRDGIIASCEGDVPAMITAATILKVLGLHSFQANPQWIFQDENAVEFAHCTLPLDMAESYEFETHFESGIGLGIHGELTPGECTVLKIGSSLTEFFASDGRLTENAHLGDRCRTQIKITLEEPVSYFLRSSLGNHHLIVYGHQADKLTEYLESLGLRRVI